MRLTNAKIKSLPIGKKVADGGGLYYQPTAVGRGKWTYRYARNGKSREMGLGTYPEVTLAEARFRQCYFWVGPKPHLTALAITCIAVSPLASAYSSWLVVEASTISNFFPYG